MSVVGHYNQLHAVVFPFSVPPVQHSLESGISRLAGLTRLLGMDTKLVAGVIRLADPKNGDITKSARQLIFKENISNEVCAFKIRKFQLNTLAPARLQRLSFGGGQNMIHVMHAAVQVPVETIGMNMLQSSASG